jgi:hypothetical protein
MGLALSTEIIYSYREPRCPDRFVHARGTT